MPVLASDLEVTQIASPLGVLAATASGRGLRSLEFVNNDPFAAPDQCASAIGSEGALGASPTDEPSAPGAHLELLREQLAAYFAGSSAPFSVALEPVGTPFQLEVWNALLAIPHGATRSYADIARGIGRPDAVRAVAAANGDNPIAILIPCHRVIGSNGSLTGYAGGLWRKAHLLKLEGTRPTLFP